MHMYVKTDNFSTFNMTENIIKQVIYKIFKQKLGSSIND